MPPIITQNTGPSANIDDAIVIPQQAFGAIYTSYHSFSKFEATFSDLGLTEIRWPGGTFAETRPDLYGFDWENFRNPEANGPGLRELIEYCNQANVALSIILPTSRFAEDPSEASEFVATFAQRLLGGDFGDIPSEFTIEIGNEYYAQAAFKADSSAYGQVANTMVAELSHALNSNQINPNSLDFNIAVQLGKSGTDDVEIRRQFSEDSLKAIDELITHRFSWEFNGSDKLIPRIESHLDAWSEAIEGAGGSDPDLLLSAFNTASFTRKEALEVFESEYEQYFGVQIDPTQIDLENRSHDVFENFYQTGELTGPDGQIAQSKFGLQAFDYGMAQASNILELYANYSSLGMSHSSIYGYDLPYNGHISDYIDDINHQFVGSSIVQMMTESLPGTVLLAGFEDNHRPEGESNAFNTYAFEDDEKIVMFVVANDINEELGAEISIRVNSDQERFSHVFVESLQSSLEPDWMSVFGIIDNPNVDETNESRSYEKGERVLETANVLGDVLNLTFRQDYEIKRLVFVKSTADLEEITHWAGPVEELVPMDSHPDSQDDFLSGTSGADTLSGGIGDDVYVINHEGDEVTEYKFEGNDTIIAKVSILLARMATNVENVFLKTNKNLAVSGNASDNIIVGNDSSNRMGGGKGDDLLKGGKGDDKLFGQIGDDIVRGGPGDDVVSGGSGDDKLYGGRGEDILRGSDGDDFLAGRKGNDILYGGEGNDILRGGEGNDILIAGKGSNIMNGGKGKNIFVLDASSSENLIQDFKPRSDKIKLLGEEEEYTLESIHGSESGTRIYFGDTSATLLGVDIEEISPTNFLFG